MVKFIPFDRCVKIYLIHAHVVSPVVIAANIENDLEENNVEKDRIYEDGREEKEDESYDGGERESDDESNNDEANDNV